MASPEQAATFYDNQPTADGDTKSRSTSGLAAAPSEHLSLQPTTEEPSENLVPELATQVTSQSHAITSSAENYIQEDVIAEPRSSESNLVCNPPPPIEVLSTNQELLSPRNSAAVTPASVTFSVPVMSELHREQEEVLMAIVPTVPTMPSACSDASTNVCGLFMANNTGNTITMYQTLQNTSVQEEQMSQKDPLVPSHPLLLDDFCQQRFCHNKMSVTLLPCRHPILCRGCAEDILEYEKKCPNCKQLVNDYADII